MLWDFAAKKFWESFRTIFAHHLNSFYAFISLTSGIALKPNIKWYSEPYVLSIQLSI